MFYCVCFITPCINLGVFQVHLDFYSVTICVHLGLSKGFNVEVRLSWYLKVSAKSCLGSKL